MASAYDGAVPLAEDQIASLRTYAVGWQPPAGGNVPGVWCGVAFSAYEVGVALEIVNTSTAAFLDNDVGLSATAVTNIVAARPLASMDALDAVPYVSTQVFQRLHAFIPSWSTPDPDPNPDPGDDIVVSGVTFSTTEAAVVLNLVNNATLACLDNDVGLNATAASNIVTARPIADLVQLDAVPYVGADALRKLKAYAPMWAPVPVPDPDPDPPPATGGTYDGVTFTAAEEAIALDIANTADPSQLTAGGVASAPAKIICDHRPWASLTALAAYSGIGAATMNALNAMVATWTGATVPPVEVSVQTLADEAANAGTSSSLFGALVLVPRAVITSVPQRSSSGVSFWVADPAAGNRASSSRSMWPRAPTRTRPLPASSTPCA